MADFEICPGGYEADLRSRSTTVDRQDQKTRRLARDLGPLRFEFDCRSADLLDELIGWKRDQYQRTHTFDILSQAWIRTLLHRLHCWDRDGLHGLLSVLFAGDKPVAMHYGLFEGDFLHYWFPVFAPEYGYGSPGTELFLQVVRECQRRGVTKIDFGYGEQAYKYKLTNVRGRMSHGLADDSSLRRTAYRLKNQARLIAKNAPGKQQLKPILRSLMPNFGGSKYEN
jgi:CelD/BcsL family acetyltransferase involved in cellulose biosynthesis